VTLRPLRWLPAAVLVAGCAETIFHPTPDTRFIEVTAGGAHSCALDQDRLAWCWGSNSNGQLGIVRRHDRQLTPVAVNGGFRFSSISAGDRHTCGIDVDTRTLCWGANDSGQLGDGTRSDRDAPRYVIDAPPFTEIAAGGRHSCAIDRDARVHCWGANEALQLGSEGAAGATSRSERATRA
jgi:alpha-tubulin suppressor-like RCC1 family protein